MPAKLVLADSTVGRRDTLPPAFDCSWTDGGPDAAWVRLAGELDVATTPQLERALREPRLQARLVVLDLRELAFIDSCGVHAIVDASIRARQVGHRMLLLHGSPGVDRVFTLTGSSDDVINADIHPIEPSAEALRRLLGAEPAAARGQSNQRWERASHE
jgi:anti-anti-sigma factor